MISTHIFLCHNIAQTEQTTTQALDQLYMKLQDEGAKIIDYPGSPAEPGFLTFFQQQLPSCQWFVLFQTPAVVSLPEARQAVNTVLKLVEQQRMAGIVRFIVEPSDPDEVPPAWSIIPAFDATYDFSRALEKLVLHLSSNRSMPGATMVSSPPAPPPGSTLLAPPPTPHLGNDMTAHAPTPHMGNAMMAPPPTPHLNNAMVAPPPTPHLSNALVPSPGTPHLSNALSSFNYDRPPAPPSRMAKLRKNIRNGTQDLLYEHKKLVVTLSILIILALLGSVLGFTVFRPGPVAHHPRPIPPIPTYGQIYFSSTNLDVVLTHPHTLDQVDAYLKNLKPPASGNSYYAWLLPDIAHTDNSTIAMGQIKLDDNKGAHLTYISPNQSNLLGSMGRFLITEEPTSPQPVTPSADHTKWRYYGEIPQTPDPNDTNHFSALDHLRHLLANGPVSMMGNNGSIPGGLAFGFVQNTQLAFSWAELASTDHSAANLSTLRTYLIDILDLLDGKNYVKQDVPKGTPVLYKAAKPLLTLDPNAMVPGYTHDIEEHLLGISNAPGVTQDLQTLAGNIDGEMNQIDLMLGKAHDDAKQLEGMEDDDLLKDSSVPILDDMTNQLMSAYLGYLDPTTGTRQSGAISVFDRLQQLAQFTVYAYNAK